MTDPERVEALLDLVDPARAGNPRRGSELVVLGLAEVGGKIGHRPTNAGWVLIGNRRRAFQPR